MIMVTEIGINNTFKSSKKQLSAPITPNRTMSIGSIALIPTSGESSPTSIFVDVTAETADGISELKRIQGYSSQLYLPEAMIYGNDLIKVWSLDDECIVGEGSQSTMIQHQEESSYNKPSTNTVGTESLKETNNNSNTATTKPISTSEEQMEDSSHSVDMDDLFLALPPTNISISPRLLPAPLFPPTRISLSPQIISPLSPLPTSGFTRRGSGNINSIVLENSSLDQDILTPPLRTKPSKGHRRGHRRNQSHFDFDFK